MERSEAKLPENPHRKTNKRTLSPPMGAVAPSLFVHDLFMMSLMLSGVAAGTAIGYVGRYGNSHAGWMEICHRLKKYCNRATASMALSYLSVVCLLLLLTVISASKSRQIKV
ncbi:hypothetical protein HRI_000402900 [Hibiscus trionum]|uniref:CASP-like protein n=1 Tax=Hibiscus trionum TaxID=183268 RepID=A0A9W7GYU6_HIBTR|nr:hypothetical protein HRI_000402900 [Hibiscus trionum]